MGVKVRRDKNSDFKFEDKKRFLKSDVDKILVKSDDKIVQELTMKFKYLM